MDAPRRTIGFARRLRRQMSPPELRLWSVLRRRGTEDLRFRRQHPIGPFVLDFYCAQASLAVEVDGEGHWRGEQPEFDERRDAWLAARGIKTLRIPAFHVRDDLEGVLTTIVAVAMDRITGLERQVKIL